MSGRLLVTGAGTAEANNLMASLNSGDRSLALIGCHTDRFILKKSPAERNHLVPPPAACADFTEALRNVIDSERIDLVLPTSDADVRVLSDLRNEFAARLFLPPAGVIELCQDKYDLTAFLRARGIPSPQTLPVPSLDDIEALVDRLAPDRRLWCRIRTGTGSRGAIPVISAIQARSWIEYWEQMRGVPAGAFTLSEYLPGRDFACQSVWKDGALILIKTCERLSYVGGASRASGVSSTPALAKTVCEPSVVAVCTRAIRALDPNVSGVFSVDLKEDGGGVPCVTEINAGRFFMITPIFDLTGKHNMALTFVRAALDEPVNLRDEYDVAEDYYLVRDLDTMPAIFHADQLFEGIITHGRGGAVEDHE